MNCAEMMETGYNVMLPQAGMDVTAGYAGDVPVAAINEATGGWFEPILTDYAVADPPLCPVNVHWHLGTEHRSEGQFDEDGTGPHPYEGHGADEMPGDGAQRRKLGDDIRQGMLCHHYDPADPVFTTPYEWKYCTNMEVGATYEVHWPHSAAGMCGSKWQYQNSFYDGVFCNDGIISLGDSPPFNVPQRVGVEGQVFTIVNSDDPMYQNYDLVHGAWKDESHWVDVAKYVGSTTGTTRDNVVCSMYSPITWQVDRACHMVSAASFDAMCKTMLEMADETMKEEVYPHGARELVNSTWSSDTLYRKK